VHMTSLYPKLGALQVPWIKLIEKLFSILGGL